MKNSSRIGIFILLLLLAIGFASVTTNLILNNNVSISAKPDDFNVIFTSAIPEEGGTATIDSTNKIIIYSTKELKSPGDKAELDYTVKNESSQYDAEIDMNISLNGYQDYLNITYETFNDTTNTIIDAKEEKMGKIIIELIKPSLEDIQIVLTVTFNANARERESIAYDTYTVRFNGNGSTTGETYEQSIKYNSEVQLLSNQFTKDNGYFMGWSTTPNGTVEYSDNQLVSNLKLAGEVIDLYASWVNIVTDISYMNTVQSYILPVTGTYKLEVWGAQGGRILTSTRAVNYGGYAVAEYHGTANSTLYIATGGEGGAFTSGNAISYGGYNGGGNGGHGSQGGAGGGGATHIATTNRGVLTNYNSYRGELLMVAGGGGGTDGSNYVERGAGGGYRGNNGGYTNTYTQYYSIGATQSAAGHDNAENGGYGTFGKGGTYFTQYGGHGGGGGYFGGGGSSRSHSGGGGGSGFINTGLTNKHMTCYSCSTTNDVNAKTISTTNVGEHIPDYANIGNGYARITIINVD